MKQSVRKAMQLLKEWQEKYLLDRHIYDKLLDVLEEDFGYSNNRNYSSLLPVKLTQLMRRRIHHWQGQDVQQSRWKRKVSSKVLDEICRHRSGRAAMGLLKEWQEKYLHLLDWHIFDKLLNVLEDDCRHSNNRNYIRGPSKHSNKRFVTLDEVGFTDVMSRISTGGGASLD